MASTAVRFVKALAYASQTPAQKTEEKKELIQQIETVKTLIKTPKAHKNRIAKELSRLERQLEKVVVLEHQLLRQNHSESGELKNQLKDLRLKLSLVHSGALKHQMDRLLFLIGEVGARVDNYVSMKEHHNTRMKSLEQSITKKMSPLNSRVSHIEQAIGQIEGRFSSLNKNAKLSVEQKKLFETRLARLRQALHKKKLEQLEKHRSVIQQSFHGSKKKHTFLSMPQMPIKIRQFHLALPSPEQVKQEEAEEALHQPEMPPSRPPVERPPEHRMILSPLPSISGRMISKRPAQQMPPSRSSAPPMPERELVRNVPFVRVKEAERPGQEEAGTTFEPTLPEPQVTNGNFAPAMPDFNVPNAPSFEGKEDELLSMLESELFPQAQKPKKTFFQKLMGK